jgi:uncharacterized protein
VDPSRLAPIAMLPFWDLDASVKELVRVKELGHKGVLFANQYEKIGLPHISDPHWDPVLAAAQDLELSVNFHIGFSGNRRESGMTQVEWDAAMDKSMRDRIRFAKVSSLGMMSNATCIADLIMDGVCERYPRLPFVSVESGFGYLPYLIELLDWQWVNGGASLDDPSRLLPSEYFRRQIYGTFWFESVSLPLLEGLQDNVMFETDFPHPTSLTPGPAAPDRTPAGVVEANLAGLPAHVARKVLHDNAARVYHLS